MKHKIIGAARGRGANRAKAVAGLFLLTSTLLVTYVGPAGATGATTHTGGGSIAPHCGDTLSGPGTAITYTLSASVDCTSHYLTPTNGLIIGADNVTLNLNGHSVIGASVANGGDEAGILIDGVDGATITDSPRPNTDAITGFDAGVVIIEGCNNTVENLNIAGNVGVDGDYGEGVQVRNARCTSLATGNKVRNNSIVGNGPYAGITLLWDSDYNTVEGNNIGADAATIQDIGIRLEQDVTPVPSNCTTVPDVVGARTTDENLVKGNTVNGSAIDGISILGGHCDAILNTIEANTVSENPLNGIRLNNRVKQTTVKDNKVLNNGGAGIKLTLNATGNTIHDNVALGNNPVVGGPVVSPLAPPHGDLHDANPPLDPPGCANNWYSNTYVTKHPPLSTCVS